jgi:hypothetical protein
MSFYFVNSRIEAQANQVDRARQILKGYMVIAHDEILDGTRAIYGGNQIDSYGKISIELDSVIKLTQKEISIIESLGPRNADESYESSLEEIFSSRLLDAGLISDDSEDEEPIYVLDFLDDFMSGSVVDVLAEMDIDCFSVDCILNSSGSWFNGQSVKLPGGVRILEEFERVKFEKEDCWSFRSQEKLVTVVEPNSFEFVRIEDLLWSSLGEAGRPRTRAIYPAAGWPVDKYNYRMIVVSGLGTLEIKFELRTPENKRLRSKKHVKVFATVEVDELQLWSGDDPIALKKVLNDWCAQSPT